MFLSESTRGTGSMSEYETNEYAGKITPDAFGLINIVLESEREWNALEVKMARAEHSAIVNEDTNLLEGAISDFFSKAKAWFISMYNKIKEFISRLVERIAMWFRGSKSFLEKYGSALEKLASNEMKGEVEIYEGLKNGVKYDVLVISNKIVSSREDNADDEDLRKYYNLKSSDDVKEEMLGSKESVKLEPGIVKTALALLRGEQLIRQNIEKSRSNFEKACKDAIKRCETITKQAIASDARKSAANVGISNSRKAIQLANSQFATAAGCITALCSDALSVCKKAYTSRPKKHSGDNPYPKSESVLDMF